MENSARDNQNFDGAISRPASQFGAHHDMMAFFNALGEVFYTVDMVDMRVMQISNACEKLFGYKQDDFLNNPMFWFGMIHHDDRHIIDSEDLILRRGERVSNEYRIIRKDESICWVENKIVPTLDRTGLLIRIDGVTRDITQRKETEERNRLAEARRLEDEEALKKSEANLRTIFDNTDTAYVLFNTDLAIISFNTLAQKYSTGQSGKPLVINRSIREYFTPERWEFIKETLDKVSRGEAISYELNFTTDDQSVQWNEVRWLNVKDEQGKNRGYILANKNITEAKQAMLEREQITADLIQHNKDVEQFTYIISHNLRAPVANIIALADMLKEVDHDPGSRKEVIDRVSSSIKNMDTVIQDLNQILQARELANETKEVIYFRELMNTIRTSIYNVIVNDHVQIHCLFDEVESMFSVRSYLYSIFYNLASNSIKYHRPGVAPVITIKSNRLKNKIELRFSDNGKGIDLAKNSSQLFGLYKRFDNTVEGKGMGLFMVKTQVEALGGTIRVKSKPGEGCEFIVQLPA